MILIFYNIIWICIFLNIVLRDFENYEINDGDLQDEIKIFVIVFVIMNILDVI